jgi:hypothetical protein
MQWRLGRGGSVRTLPGCSGRPAASTQPKRHFVLGSVVRIWTDYRTTVAWRGTGLFLRIRSGVPATGSVKTLLRRKHSPHALGVAGLAGFPVLSRGWWARSSGMSIAGPAYRR